MTPREFVQALKRLDAFAFQPFYASAETQIEALAVEFQRLTWIEAQQAMRDAVPAIPQADGVAEEPATCGRMTYLRRTNNMPPCDNPLPCPIHPEGR